MKFVAYLAGGSLLAAIVFSVVSGAAGLGVQREIWFGMFGPTLASVLTWVALKRQMRHGPQKMLGCLIKAFMLKFLFFGVYIVALAKTNQVRPEPFVCCLAFFYLASHITEAFELRKVQIRGSAE
ncbi:MAG: hypothetical protein FWF13_03515 [Acidobacteria bacterium]|nr:hypothetical protein [Acidobacteriota bacterium]